MPVQTLVEPTSPAALVAIDRCACLPSRPHLFAWVQYHIVKDRAIPSKDLSDGLELETMLGQSIEVRGQVPQQRGPVGLHGALPAVFALPAAFALTSPRSFFCCRLHAPCSPAG